MKTDLLTPVLSGGVKNTHYFNGRLLTAEALKADQIANRQQHDHLGQAVGTGIVNGLWVKESGEKDKPFTVNIVPGLALNKKGQALSVAEPGIELQLDRTTPVEASSNGLFASCEKQTRETTEKDNELYIYVLVMSSASGYEGQAPKHNIVGPNAQAGCGRRYAVEMVAFDLVPWDASKVAGLSAKSKKQLADLTKKNDNDPQRLSRLRNLLAHICFGTEAKTAFAINPFQKQDQQSAFSQYGGVDALGLTACEIPLALVYLSKSGIRFVDNWAVRRRVTQPTISNNWPLQSGDRLRAEAEAVFFQFQEQISEFIRKSPGSVLSMRAINFFRYLPPAGLLQLNVGVMPGIRTATFFKEIPIPKKPYFLEGVQLNYLLQTAQQFSSIDLDQDEGSNQDKGETQREAIMLYQVRENETASAPDYLIFTSGHLPFLGNGRFNINRWNFFHFS
ncbi:MAG: hypothetical protein DWQ04_17185 [Chloroflexi bacterium]|nr:MAG: hypothetical protein DWQ04_17185 [Chloroflexota bacterium]